MGFLNIAGGIAAGAQRADELEASRLAKTTKGDTQRLSLIEKIAEEDYFGSEMGRIVTIMQLLTIMKTQKLVTELLFLLLLLLHICQVQVENKEMILIRLLLD